MNYFNLSNLLFLHGKKDGISLEILFTYSASRFSRKDITPSAASSDAPLESIALLSIMCASSGQVLKTYPKSYVWLMQQRLVRY